MGHRNFVTAILAEKSPTRRKSRYRRVVPDVPTELFDRLPTLVVNRWVDRAIEAAELAAELERVGGAAW